MGLVRAPVHAPLVDLETFEAVQTLFGHTPRGPAHAVTRPPLHLHSGIMRCGLCGRRMQAQWNHGNGKACYRYKFPDDDGIDADRHPRSVYVSVNVKDDAIIAGLDEWLATLLDDEHVDHTCEILVGAAEPDPDYEARQADREAKIRDCDRRLAKYRSALELTDAIGPFITWIAEVEKERRGLEAQLGRSVPGGTLTPEQLKALDRYLRDIVAVLADADPADKAELYSKLGVSLTYHLVPES